MDKYFLNTKMYFFLFFSKRIHSSEDLHLIGVACIFISSKYEEIYPIRLKVYYKLFIILKINLYIYLFRKN